MTLTIAIHQWLLHAPLQHGTGDPDNVTLIQTCIVTPFPVKHRKRGLMYLYSLCMGNKRTCLNHLKVAAGEKTL